MKLKNIDFIKKVNSKYISFLFLTIILIFIVNSVLDKKQQIQSNTLENLTKNQDYLSVKKFLMKKIRSPYLNINHKVSAGESLEDILKKYNISNKETNAVIKLTTKFANPNKINVGAFIKITLKKNTDELSNTLEKITIPVGKTVFVDIGKNSQNELNAEKIVTKLYNKIVIAENTIKNNLYSSAIDANVPPEIIIEFARIYGFEIDFQRDIRKNDKFQILYEKLYDENEKYIESGSILYAYMSVNNREIALYKFGNDKNYGYYDSSGKSVEKALMKTPINGARLSSSFGMRKHPILGYNKMHKGTDFAAKKGTPIMASGTGKIEVANWNGGYGKYIRIRHNSTYKTAYAHLSSFARKIKVGKKVRQGEIIGFVGSTGRSTGPHLHYEVIINGKKVNSQKLKLPSGKILKGKQRNLFEIHRIKTDVLIAETISNKKIKN